MNKKELIWLSICGGIYSNLFILMGVLTILHLTSVPYWYENLISLIALPCEIYCLLTLGRFIGRKESKLPIEKLIDKEIESKD